MTSDPIVTIVTPSFNQGHFIRSTIESVLSQDYPRVEYIVMDGGSTDQTAAIASEYASRLTFISERDRGQSHAINKGFRGGRGDILAWLNSDDIYLPGAISTAVRAFSANPACGMVYGEGYVMDREGTFQGRFPHSRPFDLWRLVHLSDYILQQSTYFRRTALDQIGYLDEELHYGMDWDMFIRIGLKHPVCYIPEYLGCIREHKETKSSQGALVRARELHGILSKHTGMRLPPGSIIYCGEAYLRHGEAWLDRNIPQSLSFLTKAGRSFLQLGAGLAIGRTIRHAQGFYDDGWAAHKLHLMLPAGKGSFVLTGSVPEWAKSLHCQELKIIANGRLLVKQNIHVGDFELRIPGPPDMEGEPLRIEIVSSRSFRPGRLLGDRRRLAFMFNEIRWV
jgi:glycosyltransferase involved in cell wall biosynthesis